MRRVLALLAVAPLVLTACRAQAATRGYQVTDFTQLRVSGPFTVRVHVGTPGSVRATGPQAAIERISVEQNGDTLEIRPVRSAGWTNWSWGKDTPLVIDVGVRTLAAASLAGSGDLTIDKVRGQSLELGLSGSGNLAVAAVQVARLKLDATGSGDLTAGGKAGTAAVALRGSGDVHGDGLMVDTASISLVGSGDVVLGARRSAAVTIAGSGDVTVSGPARCTVARTGSGDAHCAGGGAPAAD